MSMGENIRAIRRRLNLSQQQVAFKLSITQGAISQWEKDKTHPTHDQLIALAKLFKVPISDIIGIVEQGENSVGPKYVNALYVHEIKPTSTPKTPEARILAAGIDKMPERDREKALNLVRMMFEQYAEFFDAKEGDDDNDA